jgi:hypothetical protein
MGKSAFLTKLHEKSIAKIAQIYYAMKQIQIRQHETLKSCRLVSFFSRNNNPNLFRRTIFILNAKYNSINSGLELIGFALGVTGALLYRTRKEHSDNSIKNAF